MRGLNKENRDIYNAMQVNDMKPEMPEFLPESEGSVQGLQLDPSPDWNRFKERLVTSRKTSMR